MNNVRGSDRGIVLLSLCFGGEYEQSSQEIHFVRINNCVADRGDLPGRSVPILCLCGGSAGRGHRSQHSGHEIEVIPERAFCYCRSLSALTLPEHVTTIGKRAFWGCTELARINGNTTLSEIGDYAFAGTGVYDINGVLADDPSIGFAVFAKNEFDYYTQGSFRGEEKQTDFPCEATLTEGTFYGSGINGIRSGSSENPKFTIVDGSVYTDGGKTLFVYFPMELNENYAFEKTEETEKKVFHVPEGVTRIAPYAFFECGLEQIFLPSTLTEVSDHAFTRSGVAPDAGVLTDYDGNEITSESEGILFGELSFDKWSLNERLRLTADAGNKKSKEASENEPFPDYYKMRSLAGDRSLYRAEDCRSGAGNTNHYGGSDRRHRNRI